MNIFAYETWKFDTFIQFILKLFFMHINTIF